MASFEFLAIIVSVLGLAASITYYAIVVSNANKTQQQQLETRQAQLFMPIFNQFQNHENMAIWLNIVLDWEWEDYDDFRNKFYSDKDVRTKIHSYMAYLEGAGILLERDLVDIKMVNELIGSIVVIFWEKMESVILGTRQRLDMPTYCSGVESLYRKIKTLRENR